MGLQMSIDPGKGTVYATGYIRISQLLVNKDDTVKVHTLWYQTQADRDADKGTEDQKPYIISGADYTTYFANTALDTVNQNPWERAYVWLKTLSEFSSATDV